MKQWFIVVFKSLRLKFLHFYKNLNQEIFKKTTKTV